MFKNLEAVGWSGGIAAAGYIAESGRESLFGIDLHDFNFGRYATAVGFFVTSTADIIGRAIAAHPVFAAAGFLSIVLLLTLVAQLHRKSFAGLALLALPAIILWVGMSGLVRNEMPLFRVKDVLVLNPVLNLDLGDPVATASWRRILCSHDDSYSLKTCTATDRDRTQLERQYFQIVESFFVLVVLLIAFRIVALRTAKSVHLPHGWFPAARPLAMASTAVVILFGLMLPYVHAKLIAGTTFPEVAVSYIEANDARTTRPSAVLPASRSFELHHSDEAITMYELLTAQQHVISEVPMSRVALLRYMGSKDVLALHIQQSVSAQGPVAPPTR